MQTRSKMNDAILMYILFLHKCRASDIFVAQRTAPSAFSSASLSVGFFIELRCMICMFLHNNARLLIRNHVRHATPHHGGGPNLLVGSLVLVLALALALIDIRIVCIRQIQIIIQQLLCGGGKLLFDKWRQRIFRFYIP